MGGANVIDQCLAAGLVDELRIHLSPLLMGGGTRLFAAAGRKTLCSGRSCTRRGRRT